MAPSSKKQKVKVTSDPIYFYGMSEKPYGIFSQFQKGAFTDPNYPSAKFNCAEQYMMYGKAQTFSSPDIAANILATTASKAQKALGRKIKDFTDVVWDKVKCGIVERGNYLKFSQNEKFKKVLLETGDRELVEAASNDNIWGIGFTAAGAKRVSREQWGQNLLGIALMNVRKKIRAEEAGEEDEATESADQTSEDEDDEDDQSDEEVKNVSAATKSSATKKRKHDSITKGAPKLPSSSKVITSKKKSAIETTGVKKGLYQAMVDDAEESDEEQKKHSTVREPIAKLAAREESVASKNKSVKETTCVNEEPNQLLSTKTHSKKHDGDEDGRPLKKKKKTNKQTNDELLEMLTKKAVDDSMVNGLR
ncbi:hypothetical protein AUEXF2481DRAFT_41939 [Aureobasidium subglaciale EXF-2481]|uniref:NADAR domain-containing protein n=1 Tax=Aureobasidium subglaciale (strain EXF-2481) TaxID=1043005 RepID=A0A074Z2D2_AURSE|nr:uncharacterized protein AUEXF2481DRAFT_41939 [Aureobasidium subglaciale EXF-2481]KAI5194934.1 hypothetical protein E4T38_09331 [Aureobasidium subglaciale]KAI5214015.1 hypothetical protein E4T40_09282 [Aureobasidium subglaciale]KAI5216385.1 hypothetical protein E4T41_09283 [Aureobasidium subglaciale]KAI5254210.1 hypothetical protein E4T46_09238 [Aureobasidium subglaciale]KEQ93221.1 hypothetical protein AUEXF2481DRAFT_41939 [Aureobasidium subglaciale EXF-2481]